MKEEEPIKFGIATPTVGTGTLKRAEVKLADTDSYKGRVERVSDSDKPKQPPKPPERRTPVSMGPYEVRKLSLKYYSTLCFFFLCSSRVSIIKSVIMNLYVGGVNDKS